MQVTQKIFDSSYERLELIQGGTQGEVYLGKNIITNEPVALKYFKQLIDFQKEVSIFQAISFNGKGHQNVIKMKDFYEISNHGCVIVMELCSKSLLEMLIKNEIKQEEIPIYLFQIQEGMKYLISQGFAHNDLKNENILMGFDGFVKIADFGHSAQNAQQILYMKCGTPRYMSPQQKQNKPFHGELNDVFQFGYILFQFYFLKNAFNQGEQNYLKFMTENQEYWKLADPKNQMSHEFKSFFFSLMNEEPTKRPTFSTMKIPLKTFN